MPKTLSIFSRAAAVIVAVLLFASSTAWAAARTGQPAPPFKGFALSGQPLSMDALKGSVVILDFWATWCSPCRESLPFLSELHRKYGKQGLQIVGMSVDDTGERHVKSFAAEKGLQYHIMMSSGKIQADYGVRAVPVMFVLDKNGNVAEKMMGFSPHHGKVLENLIKKLLAQPASP